MQSLLGYVTQVERQDSRQCGGLSPAAPVLQVLSRKAIPPGLGTLGHGCYVTSLETSTADNPLLSVSARASLTKPRCAPQTSPQLVLWVAGTSIFGEASIPGGRLMD